eukprot:scaffold1342_cov120-Isochrysis_galbana.AAC.1
MDGGGYGWGCPNCAATSQQHRTARISISHIISENQSSHAATPRARHHASRITQRASSMRYATCSTQAAHNAQRTTTETEHTRGPCSRVCAVQVLPTYSRQCRQCCTVHMCQCRRRVSAYNVSL